MTEKEKQIILMIGGPGSGKGTQVKSYEIPILYLDFKIDIRQRLTFKFLSAQKLSRNGIFVIYLLGLYCVKLPGKILLQESICVKK